MTQILVVRPGALGDTILTLPLLASIRRLRPGSCVLFLGRRAYKSLIPPDISFQSFDSPERLWLFSDAVSPGANIVGAFQEAYIILNQPNTVIENLRKAGVQAIRHVRSTPPEGKHVVESMHQGVGLPVPARDRAIAHLAAEKTSNLIWLHPGSGGPSKCMPLEVMVSIGEILRDETGWDLAATAAEEDSFLLQQPAWERLAALSGTRMYVNRPIEEVCKELGGARLFVGNDSGVSHLAAGLGIPSVVFFVCTDPVQWSPWAPEDMVKVLDLRAASRDARFLARECLGMIRPSG